jgi:hypothetical protein
MKQSQRHLHNNIKFVVLLYNMYKYINFALAIAWRKGLGKGKAADSGGWHLSFFFLCSLSTFFSYEYSLYSLPHFSPLKLTIKYYPEPAGSNNNKQQYIYI